MCRNLTKQVYKRKHKNSEEWARNEGSKTHKERLERGICFHALGQSSRAQVTYIDLLLPLEYNALSFCLNNVKNEDTRE